MKSFLVILWVFLILSALALLVAWVKCQLYYEITRHNLEVRWFGILLRRVALENIHRISKRQRRRPENWANTWRSSHRKLILRRKDRWYRDILITPVNRYVFRRELENAIARREQDLARSTAEEKEETD